MARIFQAQSPDTYVIGRGHVLFRKHGTEAFISLGDVDSFNLSKEVERAERYGKEAGIKTLARSVPIQSSMSCSFTCYQFTNAVRAMAMLGNPDGKRNQSQATGETVTVTAAKAGDIIPLGHAQATNVSVTDAVTSTFTEGTHYRVDSSAGYVEVVVLPGGSAGDLTITYDAPEITDGFKTGFMSDIDLRGEIHIRETQDTGQKYLTKLHSVAISPDGDQELIGDDEFMSITLNGDVEADGTKPAGEEFGTQEIIG